MIKLLKYILKKLNIGIAKYTTLELTYQNINAKHNLDLLLALPREKSPQILDLIGKSKSQLNQELFVLAQLNFKRDGYFVEFGAADGLVASNTYLLEKCFGWSGILAEPAKCWHKMLANNRNVNIDISCVWGGTGAILKFNEAPIAELSTLSEFSSSDGHHKSRKKGRSYEVKTISLMDLLKKYNSPQIIDYLSLDTEGSEFEILSRFDFTKYKFRVITCEHNFTPMREKIYNLLTNNGYKRVLTSISQFDDWYIQNG